MSARKATKTTLGVTVYVLIVLAIIAVVGLVFQLTNGFTDEVKTFYVTVDRTIVTDASVVQFELRKIVLTEFILRNFFFHLRDTSIFFICLSALEKYHKTKRR